MTLGTGVAVAAACAIPCAALLSPSVTGWGVWLAMILAGVLIACIISAS